jgi:3-deoxy-D-manno-octulosonate 8-phosphate phosphatase (KDO 8-P phosphatase)
MLPRPAAIRLLAFDVDGVFTDGRLLLGDDGAEYKVFHVRDGHGVRQLLEAGVAVAVVSGRNSPAVNRRMQELGVQHVFQGVKDKVAVLENLLGQLQVTVEQAAFVGDDRPDLPAMAYVGQSIAVADAHASVRAAADWVTQAPGGAGAVREVCDLLLAAHEAARKPTGGNGS